MTEPNTELPPLTQPWATNIAPTVWAVQLTDDADWEAIAAWVGGTVESTRDATDEYQSWIAIPREGGGAAQVAHEDWWVIRNEASGRIVASPTFVSAEVVAELRARLSAKDGRSAPSVQDFQEDIAQVLADQWNNVRDPDHHLAAYDMQDEARAVYEEIVAPALDTLRWLHAEAVWHAEHHRAQAETQSLSHALLLRGFRGFADQVDAMARKIREQDAQFARSADENEWLSEACRLTVREAATVRAERDRLLKDAAGARETLMALVGGDWTVEPSLSELAHFVDRFWKDDRRKLEANRG